MAQWAWAALRPTPSRSAVIATLFSSPASSGSQTRGARRANGARRGGGQSGRDGRGDRRHHGERRARSTRRLGDLQRAELLSIPVTLIVLLFAFGAIVAALVPVLLALTAVGRGPLWPPLARERGLPYGRRRQDARCLLIGMAVGVDYGSPLDVILLPRGAASRPPLARGARADRARTSGAHGFSSPGLRPSRSPWPGCTSSGREIFNGLATGTITVIFCAVAAGSVTVLPAVRLNFLGARIDKGRIPFSAASDDRHLGSRAFGRPSPTGCFAGRCSRAWPPIALLVALALPALWGSTSPSPSRRVALVGGRACAPDTREGAGRVFPSTAAPAIVVVVGPRRLSGTGPGRRHEGVEVGSRYVLGIAHRPFTISTGGDQSSAFDRAPPLAGSWKRCRKQACDWISLRHELVPQTFGQIPGVETAVTGITAEDVDFTRQMKHGVPYVIAFVLALAFVLLLLAFRSIVVPLKAIVLNLLSVAAAYGVLVLVFQHTWAEPILRFQVERLDHLVATALPLRGPLRALDGLPRVHPQPGARSGQSGMTTDEAVRQGITVTAGVVTSAALVMVGVFSLFGLLSSLELNRPGVGTRDGGADRCDDRPRRASALDHGVARRSELVPAALARAHSARADRGAVCARALLVQDQQHAPGAKGRCSSIRARAARVGRHHAEYALCL